MINTKNKGRIFITRSLFILVILSKYYTRKVPMTAKTSQNKQSSNNLRQIREEKLLSLPELARRVGLSPLTVKRVEDGGSCRMETKRKILEALEVDLKDRLKVFPED
jgi:DNA-binding transcriptional regulator YiaG